MSYSFEPLQLSRLQIRFREMNVSLRKLTKFSLAMSIVVIAGCSTTKKEEPVERQEPTIIDSRFTISDFDSIQNISEEAWSTGLEAFQTSCRSMGKKRIWAEVCAKAQTTPLTEAKNFFMDNFAPWQMSKVEVGKQTGTVYNKSLTGLMTGYYEPLLKIKSHKTSTHTIPILSTPDDLIIVDLASLYPSLKGLRLRGKLEGRRLIPYDDRKAIVQRKDLDKYALGWSDDPVAVFFLQIQGSGRLETDTGDVLRVGYDDQNGHPYKAVGSWLVKKGYLKKHQLSMQNIQKWAKENPSEVNTLLDQNPSFVFFKERVVKNQNEGPVGAQGLPLTSQGSVAVDRKHVPLGTPLIVQVSQDNPPLNFTRPVVAQDTGGAIRGPLRFDFFWGFGDSAGAQAGRQKSDVTAWLLLPKGVSPDDIR